jgi:hypothetical protein
VLLDQLEDPRSFPLPRLGGRRRASMLDDAQSVPEIVDDLAGKGQQILL